LDNVTIYTSPGFGIAVLQGSSGLAISNCKVTRAPGRPISTAADALHITNSGGDILIENNVFAYQGDDGLNINAMTFPITAAGTNQISVPAKGSSPTAPRPRRSGSSPASTASAPALPSRRSA